MAITEQLAIASGLFEIPSLIFDCPSDYATPLKSAHQREGKCLSMSDPGKLTFLLVHKTNL